MITNKSKNFFRVSAEDFKKIPGSPIAYWVGSNISYAYQNAVLLADVAEPKQGLKTGDNDTFLRLWHEIEKNKFSPWVGEQAKWFPCNKGGEFRLWYGNNDFVIDWENDGYKLKNFKHPDGRLKSRPQNLQYMKREGLTYTNISTGNLGIRFSPKGFLFDAAGSMIFSTEERLLHILSFLCSKVATLFTTITSPTMSFEVGQLSTLPIIWSPNSSANGIANACIRLEKIDWDSYETSWDFQTNSLLQFSESKKLISEAYLSLRLGWRMQAEEMRKLEVENNRIFIDAYGLQDELTPEVPWNEITLTCNPWYRYGKNPEDMDLLGNSLYMNVSEGKVMPTSKQEEDCPAGDFPFAAETEQRLLEDTIKEFISYAVGCMMGRYSPEKRGLILANQSNGQDEDAITYETTVTGSNIFSQDPAMVSFSANAGLQQLTSSYASFYPVIGENKHFIMDRDGILPILDEEWFFDDIVTQFKAFVALTFGVENLSANMDFIEAVLGKDIRKYFVKDFYKEHIQRYKKRPIYWLFSSPKGSFNALIYLHRYTPDTVSIVLNEYLRELMTKISTRIKHLIEENNRADISNSDKTRNLKQIDKYTAQLAELEDYERDVIFPLAQQKIAIDLDDGVKVNYCKFGAALKKIPGLEAKEE